MFTGIIETTGRVQSVVAQGSNRTYLIESPLSPELKIDQSLSHNGVCLTVEAVADGTHSVSAIEETLKKTNLATLQAGDLVNLERCLPLNGRLDGHLVQGHVDAIARCLEINNRDGSWEYRFEFDAQFAALVIEKGSVCLNGISLTAFDVTRNTLKVAIIPYTYQHTNIRLIGIGDPVNIEFDLIGKYLLRSRQLEQSPE
ncbi:riboflavin synthase [Niabella terrae]